MKTLNKTIIVLASVLILSCNADDVENRPVITPGTTPILLTPKSDFNIVLTKDTETNTATTVIWNDATYQGDSTIITYSIEIAKKGTAFKTPYTVSTTKDRFKAITVSELNAALINAGFIEKVENEVDMRIKSVVGASGVPQYSNSYTFKATPYRVPLASSHWLVGAATPGGWSWDGDSETEFPLLKGKTDVYQVSIVLKNGESFREFLGNNFTSNGNWDKSHNYPYYSGNGFTITPELVNAADGDSNFRYIGPTGLRVLTIDNTAKKITLE